MLEPDKQAFLIEKHPESLELSRRRTTLKLLTSTLKE